MKSREWENPNKEGERLPAKKITESSLVYQKEIDRDPYQAYPLGRSLFYLEEFSSKGRVSQEYEESQRAQDVKDLNKIKVFLANTRDPKVIKYIKKLVSEVYSGGNSEVKKAMTTWYSLRALGFAGEMKNFFHGISDQLLIDMLREHNRIFREEQAEMGIKFSVWAKENIPMISTKLTELGINLSDEFIQRRLAGVKVYISDPLRDLMRSRNWQGGYNPSSHAIYISAYDFEEDKSLEILNATLIHEFLHALSGKTLVQFGVDNDGNVSEQKMGLAFHAGENERFGWLAEAVTEDLTNKILKREKDEIYAEEQELFSLLQNSGATQIPIELFYAANFENYDPTAGDRKESAIPKWHQLRRVISESYSPTFLVNLDQFAKKFGIKKTILVMKKEDGWQEIDNQKF